MLDEQTPVSTGTEDTTTSSTEATTDTGTDSPPPRKRAPRKAASRRPAGAAAEPLPTEPPPSEAVVSEAATPEAPVEEADVPAKAPARKRAPRKTAAKKTAAATAESPSPEATETETPPVRKAAKRAPRKSAKTAAAGPDTSPADGPDTSPAVDSVTEAATGTAADPAVRSDAFAETEDTATSPAKPPAAPMALFQPPDPAAARPVRKRATRKTTVMRQEPAAVTSAAEDVTSPAEEVEAVDKLAATAPVTDEQPVEESSRDDTEDVDSPEDSDEGEGEGGARRRRRRGGRRRRKGSGDSDTGADEDDSSEEETSDEGSRSERRSGGQRGRNRGGQGSRGDQGGESEQAGAPEQSDQGLDQGDSDGEGGTTRRRRRRRRAGDGDDTTSDDPENTVVRVRKPRSAEDEISTFSGSTRLEAKKQRRREGREAGRRRAPIISEAEFLARREAVDRKMVIRQKGDLTQIAVLEDNVLVEHYVARDSQTSLIGNVYLGRVQNVLPSMEAAFIDIGKGRNAVLYAGEVNWDALGAKDGKQRKIEQVLKPGQSILVQVSKDPIGHKGARLTSQVSLPGRFLVYVPDGTTSGISRKLPENERGRLKSLLKDIVPDTAGVIVRTAAEGASESELTRDVERLKALWEEIESKVAGGNAPQLLYGEPDLTVKVVRDLFTEDIGELVISGAEAWQMVEDYVSSVAPDLAERVARHDDSERDAFAEYRIDEQIAKALDRKVWLPSGGSLVIDRTEAMTVVDVNTGKFTGSGGNLEETVTKNNLEAAEEIVRQLRLRDIGGIIVVDFIDMVLENNRDLVLRRMIECLGRDRTRHQVAEVTSLGLVQMTRKRIGTGLLEAFSEPCEHCQGRGLHLHSEPVDARRSQQQSDDDSQRGRRGRGRGKGGDTQPNGGGGNGRKDTRDGTTAAEDKDTANGSVRRPTPAEFAAMVRSEAASDVRPDAAPGEEKLETPTAVTSAAQLTESAEAPEAIEPPEASKASEAGESAQQPVAPEEPVVAPVPAGPRVVTRVRRSGARRAAGPPAGLTSEGRTGTAVEEVPEQVTAQEQDGREPAASSSTASNGTEPNETVSDGGASIGSAPDDGESGGDTEGIDAASQPHVPVKKKGSRKR